jgi:TRAP transporter 4TM/12TM fusion protein
MPPIMAAAGFILASFVGVPYIKVAAAAAIPAILYFFSVGVSVHLISTKYSILGIPRNQIPALKGVILSRGILIVPIFVIIILLYYGFSPMKAGFYAIISSIVVSLFSKKTRIGLVRSFWILEKAGRSVLQLTATCACAGIIVSTIIMSGLGMKMPWLIKTLAGDSLLFSSALAALGALILGMGMSTTASYVLSATLLAPALTRLGLPELPVHLFLLYFGIINNVTPPVAIASYAAASVAESDLWQTAINAFKLAIAGFVIPFFFIFNQALLLEGPILSILRTTATAVLGVIALSVGVQGYCFNEISKLERLLFIFSAFLLIHKLWKTDLTGIVLMGALIFLSYRRKGTHS